MCERVYFSRGKNRATGIVVVVAVRSDDNRNLNTAAYNNNTMYTGTMDDIIMIMP